MRIIALFALLSWCLTLSSQQLPPPNQSGASLRAWIKSTYYDGEFTNLGYSQARRRMYNYIDNQDDTVFCVYGQYPDPVPFGGTTTFPDPINAEHTVPQSFFNGAEPMRADIHHLFPTHMNINSARGNLPFGEVPDNQTDRWMRLATQQSSIPGSDIDSYSEVWDNTRFEPREDHKGDCARAIFYFYTMYPTQGGNISGVGDVQQLYQWHILDPPSASEIQRNDGIEQYQGNRNPYIDHPDWVVDAWEITLDPMERPSSPAGLSLSVLSSGLQLSWMDGPDELGYYLYRAVGAGSFEPLATLAADTETYLDGSVQTDQAYRYMLLSYNLAGESLPSDTVSGVLPAAGLDGLATDLLITEYVEGTTFNKALEISNFTGASVNLAQYALVKQTNGAGAWADTFRLSGVLDDSAVWVLMHPQAEPLMLQLADMTTDQGVMTFNGNDAIALLKNDSLLDVVGIVDQDFNFGLDRTLRRKWLIRQPVEVYDSLEWNVFPLDTYSDLGTHDFGSPPLGLVNRFPELEAVVRADLEGGWEIRLLPQGAAPVRLRVWDLTGRVLWQQEWRLPSQEPISLKLDRPIISPGIYLMDIQQDQARFVQRLRIH